MGYVHLTDFRANLAKHLDKVEDDRDHLVVTRQGKPPFVVMPLGEYEAMLETMHLNSSAANAKRLREAIAKADKGLATERALIEPEAP